MEIGNRLTDIFSSAKRNDERVVLYGFHAIKHATRFGAEFEVMVSCDEKLLCALIKSHAPDVEDKLLDAVNFIDDSAFKKLAAHIPHTKIIGVARKPNYDISEIINTTKPVILLDNPSNPANAGAVVRVCAAIDAGVVLSLGELNMWTPLSLSGSQGLHFAIPVFNITEKELKEFKKPIVVFDERGKNIHSVKIPQNAIFVFGGERNGVSKDIKENSDLMVRIPMRAGVSSLNLATAVSAVLYMLK